MKQTLYYLSGFNNYFNRQVKKPSATEVAEYQEWIVHSTNPTNFNPNDGVSTTMVVNYTDTELDYMIASEDNITISSRWFVIEQKRNLAGQYTVTLRRDLMADYFQEIITSPCYIERALLNLGNYLIFNSEGNSYNQIKKREVLLQDETKSGWLVGYLATNHEEKSFSLSTADKTYPAPLIDYNTLNTWVTNNKNNINFLPGDIRYKIRPIKTYSTPVNQVNPVKEIWDMTFTSKGGLWSYKAEPANGRDSTLWAVGTINNAISRLENAIATRQDELLSNAETLIRNDIATDANYISENNLKLLQQMNNGTYEEDGKVFTVTVELVYSFLATKDVTTNSGALYTSLLSCYRQDADIGDTQYAGTNRVEGFQVQYFQDYYNITLTSVASTADCTIKKTVNKLEDAPYKMFAIPYTKDIKINVNNTQYYNNSDVAKRLAANIATTYGGTGTTFLYDIQLLPYCPVRNAVVNGGVDVDQLTVDIDYTLATADDAVQTIILWSEYSNFNLTINYAINVPKFSAIDFKVDNETKFVRLCSPNYSGAFEFKPTMNYGVTAFEVNCTYKPYQPYIHVAPLFNIDGLYGGDFNDQRGLICTGDFSLPIVTDAWIQYQINNKSYKDSFDRQIENMETNYSINRRQQEIAGTINVLSAGLGGFAGGAGASGISGLGIGSSAGIGLALGAASAVGSGLGLQADLRAMEQLHREAVSYNTDQFNYQLQNIKALPYSLGKVGAFNINNKIFPFIEFYEATEEEVDALRMKLKYNSFTVGVIGTIQPYIQSETSFIQGKFIRLLGDADYHLSVEIASEFHKGVYI